MHATAITTCFRRRGTPRSGLARGRAADRDLDAIFVGHNSRDVAGRRDRTAVDRAGMFLRQICGLPAARLLVTSRLRPADFETRHRQLVGGVTLVDRMHLRDADAIALMRGLGVRGAAGTITRIARSVENHPLTLRVLAGDILYNGRAGHDIDRWIELQPNFNPSGLELIQRKSHILFGLSRDEGAGAGDPVGDRRVSRPGSFRRPLPGPYSTGGIVRGGGRLTARDSTRSRRGC